MCALRFAVVNIQGLASKSTNKLNCPEICDLFNNNDIIMFVETWGHRHINFHVPHFQYFELNRTIYNLQVSVHLMV